MKRFDLLNDPLAPGAAVIEASAGTGKTFTLAGLVLRLLLEPDGDNPPPGIGQILVVTYTNAATDELRDRIRRRLRDALDALERGDSADPLEAELLRRTAAPDARQPARRRLQDALTLFDQAAIFTIHGFCQRVLSDRAFETDGLFDTELAADDSARLREVAVAFVREQLARATPALVAAGLSHWLTPEALLEVARVVQPHAEFSVIPEPGETADRDMVAAHAALVALWRERKGPILAQFGGGKTNPTFNAPYNKDEFAASAESIMTRLARGEPWTDEVAKVLEQLRVEKAQETVSKRAKQPADFTFFQTAQAVLDAGTCGRQSWQARFARQLPDRLAAAQRRAKTQSFDTLLRRTAEALAGPAGSDLIAALRHSYRAALIDEFQDTDPLQWPIFRQVFAGTSAGHRLRLIGDPKQAIYGFRGADVATYLAARASVPAEGRSTLGTNWRSEGGLVAAVNHLFARHPQPFAHPHIAFDAVVAGGLADRAPLNDPRSRAPLHLWLLGDKADAEALSQETAAEQARAAILAEIERLLHDPEVRLGDRRLRPQDIAVLVPTNRHALAFQEALRGRGIPSVVQAAESVFESAEVGLIADLLAALEAPSHPGRLRRVLASPAIGFTLAELARPDADARFAADAAQRFAGHVRRWETRGFAAMFRGWLETEGIRERLMARPDGERRLTNLLHLGELLQAAERDGRTGGALGRWLAEQQQAGAKAAGETEMRLESDESAVRLVTVHKSKGLEYPVVFGAFLWRGVEPSRNRQDEPLVIRREGAQTLVDLAGFAGSEHRDEFLRGALQERLRLLYVALTRARNRCYLLTGAVKGFESSALGWLVHARAGETPEQVRARLATATRADLRAELQTLAAASDGTVSLTAALPRPPEVAPGWREAAAELAGPRRYIRTAFPRWGIQSFSGLTANVPDEAPDHDALAAPAAMAEAEPEDEFARLPRGTGFGTCVHEVFEQIDFTAKPERWQPIVAAALRKHQLADMAAGPLLRLLEQVLTTPLESAGEPFRLREISPEQRLTELEFFLPLQGFTVGSLRRVFARHSVPVPEWPERLGALGIEEGDGFLHGYVDLIFERAGRFHLLDWKTNWLGPIAAAYTPDTVARAMRGGFYVLQYHLYAVALRRYLRLRRPGVEFAQQWGGVHCAFVRGADARRPQQGWFRDCPDAALLDDLETALTGGESR
jgi:exodeoxyribonuclease V beta subunit